MMTENTHTQRRRPGPPPYPALTDELEHAIAEDIRERGYWCAEAVAGILGCSVRTAEEMASKRRSPLYQLKREADAVYRNRLETELARRALSGKRGDNGYLRWAAEQVLGLEKAHGNLGRTSAFKEGDPRRGGRPPLRDKIAGPAPSSASSVSFDLPGERS